MTGFPGLQFFLTNLTFKYIPQPSTSCLLAYNNRIISTVKNIDSESDVRLGEWSGLKGN